ncbi:MAG: sensor histidine kinase, partial [Microbacterium gubbeenense]
QVLGVLRAAGNGVEPPQPTLADLPALIEDAAQAGARIDVENDAVGDPPDLVSRTAYRVVQEALTNARKHAPGAPIRVRVDGRAGGLLVIEVTNGSALAAPRADVAGSGLGLMGLAERVDLVGGTLEFGPDGKAGFAVRAWLPWEESDD